MRKIYFKTVFTGLIISTSLILLTCKQSVQPEEDETGVIIPGIGMEGIKLGDSKETVIAKVGKLTGGGSLQGMYRSWLSYDCDEGPHAGISIDFIVESDGSCGPVDEIRAPNITTPYNGRTKEGIGVGSLLISVHNSYGLPDTSIHNNQGWLAEFYCLGQKKFEIHYKDSIVTGFSIGYYIPIPEDPLYPCK